MLAKKYRLPVQNMRKKTGKSLKSRYFLLKIFTPEELYSRVGVVISRKVSPKAIVRNRLKRIIFDFFQKNLLRLSVNDYLVIVSPTAGLAEKKDIFSELDYLLHPTTNF